ncbi:MAG: hypothetical protein EXS63_01350 [Candidatus Omnitrophica bacterium]|nr:hypothetical protein [Candidatus Omnitrophota bacterium]
MKFKILSVILILSSLFLNGCATGRNLASSHYLSDEENKFFNFPNPSETSAGYWAVKAARKTAYAVGRTILFPFAILSNGVVNVYLISTWPFRWIFQGDKRLIVWYPLFGVGENVGSSYYSKEWNHDLI